MYFEHNIEIFQRFEPVILEHHECCLIGAMGTGKTDISIEFIKKYNQKTLVIVPLTDLGDQWKDIAEKNDISTLSVVTYHTFSKAFAVLATGYDCYIFDEAHHMDTPIWGKAIRKFREMIDNDKYIIGLTGDSIRYFDSCKNVVGTMFHGHVVYGLSQYDAIMKGILPNVIYVCAIYDTKGLYDKYKGMATTKHLQGKLNLAYENCKKITDILVSHAMDHMKGFVFVDKIESINSGIDLISKTFPDMPIYSAHSKMTKNEKSDNINGFKSNNTGFMVSVNMFNEGHHINGTNAVIMLRKTGSPTIYTQQIGRALSANYSGTAIIYDFVANSESMKSIGERISTITNMIENEFATRFKRGDRISSQVIVHDYSKDFLEVVEEIDSYTASNVYWTPEEDQIIRDNYPTMGAAVYKLLPNRTKSACLGRIHVLGLRRTARNTHEWSEEEDKIMKDNYPIIGPSVYKLLPGRTREGCKIRANILGLKTISHKDYSESEDRVIIENYPIMGSDVYLLLPGRSKQACQKRANILGVKTHWTDNEIQILRDNYPNMGPDVCKLIKSKTRNACLTKASSMGIKFVGRGYWTAEEDQILKDNYPSIGKDVYKLLPGRTEIACYNRARILNVNRKK